jgi:hypothetical protein
MPVIINDFEVVAEPAPEAGGTEFIPEEGPVGAPPSREPAVPTSTPLDILRIEEHQLLRRMRLAAF